MTQRSVSKTGNSTPAAKPALPAGGELSEADLDRVSAGTANTLSNATKKIDTTADTIVQNLKG